jgi:hypothetical protein
MKTPHVLAAALFAAATAGAQVRFDVYEGQVLSRGRLVHVRVPDAVAVDFFLRPVDGRKSTFLGTDNGSQPPPAYGPDCEDGPCRSRGEFTVRLGTALRNVKTGPADLLVVSPAGSGRVVGTRRVYWSDLPPRARITSPAFGAVIPASGAKVIARTRSQDVVEIKVFAVTPFTSNCPEFSDTVPPFEQHWLGNELGVDGRGMRGHSSCAPTSVAATLQFLQDNLMATVVPNYPDCTLVPDCADLTKDTQYRCLVTDLGKQMDTNGIVTGDPHWGTTTVTLGDGTAAFLKAHFGYMPGVDYDVIDEYWNGAADTGYPPETIAETYFAGGAFTVGMSETSDASQDLGHFVAVDHVTVNANGTAELTVMEPHVADDDTVPACGAYKTYHLGHDGTIQYQALPDDVTIHAKVSHIVHFSGFGKPPGCGRDPVPVAGKMINLKWWEGVFVPPAPGAYLLYSESRDRAGHVSRDYQYVIAEPADVSGAP